MRPLRDAVVAVVGLGLMGGSLALALRAKNACREILGIERDTATRAHAIIRRAVDQASPELSAASAADVIVLATPVHTIIEQLQSVGEIARDDALIIDLGSTKRAVVRAMEQLPAHVQPIGGHPLCGKETFGFAAADANLYQNALFVLTPLARTSPNALDLGRALVECIGARPILLDAARHDTIVAAVSHLPFALAATLMSLTDGLACADDLLYVLAAGGFRDTTRLAASDTTMMLDTLLTNRETVAEQMHLYARRLAEYADWLGQGNASALRAVLQSAATKRRELFRSPP